MKHRDGRFTGAQGHSIYYQYWEPELPPRAVLLVAHGAGEHSSRYLQLAQFFTGHHYAVAALDLNGHGNSEGIPGHVNDLEDYLFELGVLHQQVTEHFVGVPVFLLGHSMGGLIGSLYLLQHQTRFQGAILSGPAIMTSQQPPLVQVFAIRLLAVLAPRLGVLQLDASGVSRDPQVVKKYVEDPQVLHGKMSARMVRELFAGMNTVQAEAAEITLPILLLHGGEDVMTSPQGSRFLCDHVGSVDKTDRLDQWLVSVDSNAS